MWVTLVFFYVSVSLSTPLHPICHAPLSERSLLPPLPALPCPLVLLYHHPHLYNCVCVTMKPLPASFRVCFRVSPSATFAHLPTFKAPLHPLHTPFLSITSLTSAISLAVLCPLVSVLSPRTDCSSWSRDRSRPVPSPLPPGDTASLDALCLLALVFFACVLIHCSLVGDAEHVWLSPDEEQP